MFNYLCVAHTVSTMATGSAEDLRGAVEGGRRKLVRKSDAKSAVWDKFDLVVDSATLAPVGYVRCMACQAFLVYDSSKSGTSHLQRHPCKAVDPEKASITKFLKRTSALVPPNVKQSLSHCIARFCAQDLRPDDIVSGNSFAKLALMNIGARHGPLDAANILPHRTTVARKVEELAANVRCQLMPEILSAMNESRCAITTDMWTDDYRKISYTTATAHYIDERDEVSEYLRTESLSACSESELLEFWKGKEKKYPKLAKLPRKILAIPATSASSERNFSAAGYVMQERRTRLKPESMDNLLFLHDNL